MHRFSRALAVATVFLSLSESVPFAAQSTSLRFPVSQKFLERMREMGFKSRDEKKPYRMSSNKVSGGFQYQYKPDRHPIPTHLYRSDNGNKRWEPGKPRDRIYSFAGVSVEFSTFLKEQYKHKSLKKRAKPNRKQDKKYTSALGAAPKVTDVPYVYETRIDFQSGRRAGTDVEKLTEFRSHYLHIIGNIYGAPHASSLAKLQAYPGPVKTTSLIRYTYDYTSFGKTRDAVLLVKLTVYNGINDPSLKTISPEQIEDAVYWAIAEAVGQPEIAAIPKRDKVPDSNIAANPAAMTDKENVGGNVDPEPLVQSPPKKPTSPTGGIYGEAFDVLRQLEKTKLDLLSLRAQLRALYVTIAEEKLLLSNATATLKALGSSSPHAEIYRELIADSENKIAELSAETDRLLKKGDTLWESLRAKLDQTIAKSAENKLLQKDLQLWHKSIDKLHQISKLELLLVAGKRGLFKSQLPAALNDPELNERASELRATGLLDEGKYAEALYALRNSTKKYPNNTTLQLIMSNVEVNYLKLISAKTFSESDRLRNAWNQYMVGADESYLKQIFKGGIKRGFHRVVGTVDFREKLLKERISLAAIQQNGIELMWRLRQRGLTFEQIKLIESEDLRKRLIAMAPDSTPPTDDSIDEMMLSLMSAFIHPDVENLLADNKRLMQVDNDENYLGSDVLETEGAMYVAESIMDFTSIKNVLMIFGPMAKIRGVGAIGSLAQRFGMSGAGRAAAVESGAALTAQEWIYARPALQSLAKSIGNTRAGQALSESQHAIRALRYDSSLPIRWSTGTAIFGTEVAANWMLADGLGRVGNALGGEYGQMAGEIGSGFIGFPISGKVSQLQERWQKSMTAMKSAKSKWKATEAILKKVRAPIQDATETIAAGGTLSQPQITTLKSAVNQLDEIAGTSATATASAASGTPTAANANSPAISTLINRDAAAETSGSLLSTLTDEARTLSANARAVVRGQTDEALATSAAAKTLQNKADELVNVLDEAEEVLEGTLQNLRRQPPNPTTNADTLIPGSTIADELVPSRSTSPNAPKPKPSSPSDSAYGELLQKAESAMKKGDFDEATSLLHTASRLQKSTDVVEELLAEANAASRMAKINARKAASNSGKLRKLASEADEAIEPFSAAQRTLINGTAKKNMIPLTGAGDALRINDASGKAIAVWKPAIRAAADGLEEEGQMIAEVLASRLAKKLGLRVPYAEPHILNGEAGVLIRWIPKTTNLSKFKPGAKVAFKSQIAEFRPMQILTGNYDIHFGNFKVDSAGRLWSIDAGMSYLKSPDVNNLAYMIQLHSGGRFGINGNATHTINSARWLRDLYNYTADLPQFSDAHIPVRRMNQLITGQELKAAGQKLKAVSDTDLRSIITEIMESAPKSKSQTDEIVTTLIERRNGLPSLLNEHWPSALPAE